MKILYLIGLVGVFGLTPRERCDEEIAKLERAVKGVQAVNGDPQWARFYVYTMKAVRHTLGGNVVIDDCLGDACSLAVDLAIKYLHSADQSIRVTLKGALDFAALRTNREVATETENLNYIPENELMGECSEVLYKLRSHSFSGTERCNMALN